MTIDKYTCILAAARDKRQHRETDLKELIDTKKKLMRVRDIDSAYPPTHFDIPYIIKYVDRWTKRAGTEEVYAFSADSAVWVFMQKHPPEQCKINAVYQVLSSLPGCEYNAIGRRNLIEDLKSKKALTYDQEKMLAELEAEDKNEYTPRDYFMFPNEFKWIIEEDDEK